MDLKTLDAKYLTLGELYQRVGELLAQHDAATRTNLMCLRVSETGSSAAPRLAVFAEPGPLRYDVDDHVFHSRSGAAWSETVNRFLVFKFSMPYTEETLEFVSAHPTREEAEAARVAAHPVYGGSHIVDITDDYVVREQHGNNPAMWL